MKDETEIEELKESEEVYKTPVKTSPEAITVTDLEGNITYVSENTLKLHSFKKAEELIASEDHEKTKKNIKKTLKEGIIRNIEYTFVRKDGSRFAAELSASLIKDDTGKPKSFIATTRDITERKNAEWEIKQSEEMYRLIVENTTDVIMLTEPDGVISYLNPSCEKVLGHCSDDLVGKIPWIIHPDDMEMVKKVFYKALKGEKGPDFEYRIITKKKETKWVHHSYSPIMKNDRVRLVVSIVRDITERKKAEEITRESKEKLEQKIRELERFSRLTVGRELRMVELKKRIKELEDGK